MKKLLIHFCCLFILFNMTLKSYGQTSVKKNVAVLDLISRGAMSKTEAGTLTDRLRSMLVRTDKFNVLERGKMEEILKEVGFQQTGCTTTECAVEAGKILNVEQMISGSLGKIGTLYTIDIVLIDVVTSQILRSITRDYRGEIEGLISFMETIANQIAEISEPEPTKIEREEEQLLQPSKKSKKWVWIGGGTLLVGGVVAAILLSGEDKEEKPSSEGFPNPPGRP